MRIASPLTEIMLKFDTPIDTQLQDFWTWWTGELASLVPGWVSQLFGGGGEFLALTRDGKGVGLSHIKPGIEHQLAHFTLDEEGENHRREFMANNPHLGELRTVLRLSGQQGLRKQIKLPMAAAENLNQVIAFELDRMTPFKNEQVYFSATIVSRLKATKQILVDLVLTPRAKLDGILEELTAAGWRPELVYLTGDPKPGAYNLLPEKFRPPRSRLPEILNYSLGTIILSLAILAAVLPIWSARSEATRLEEAVKKTGKTAQEVESMREESEKLLHRARFLQDKKHSEPVLVDSLEELTRLIPDGTWLNGLQFANRRIIIQGQSPSASSLIQRIEGSAFFDNVSFVSPVTKDTSNGLERFQIATDAVNGRFSEKPR